MEKILKTSPTVEHFLQALRKIPDKRDNRGKIHSYVFIITGVILGILAGRSTTSSLHRYIENKIVWLREVTKMKDAKPISRAHLPRILNQIDWKTLDQLIMSHFNVHLPREVVEEWLGVDGKVLKGTLKSGEKQAIIHAVTHKSGREVGQARQSGNKSSEIPAVRKLLKESGLEKRKVTLDAHHCNPKTTAQIASAKGRYLTQVKKNQLKLLKQCKELGGKEKILFSCENCEKANGRLTTRKARVYAINAFSSDARWQESCLETLVVIKRETLTIKSAKTSEETSYYVSNQAVKNDDSKSFYDLVEAVRGHWAVESNNWILDVTFNEDKVKTTAVNQSYIMGRLRSFALQLLRKAGVKNFQAAMERFADSTSSMEMMLRQVQFL